MNNQNTSISGDPKRKRIEIVNDFVVLLLFLLLSGVLAFLTNVKLANVLGKEDFGTLSYSLTLGLYGAAIARFGMDRTLVRDIVHFSQQSAQVVFTSLVLRCGLFAGLMLVLFLVGDLLAEKAYRFGFFFLVFANSLMGIDLQAVYDSQMRMRVHAFLTLAQKVLYFGFIWLIILYFPEHLTLSMIGIAALATMLIYLAAQFYGVRSHVKIPANSLELRNIVRRLVSSNVPVWLGAIGCLSFGGLNQVFLKHYCGAASLGEYAVAWQFVVVAMLVMMQAGRIANAGMVRLTKPNEKQ